MVIVVCFSNEKRFRVKLKENPQHRCQLAKSMRVRRRVRQARWLVGSLARWICFCLKDTHFCWFKELFVSIYKVLGLFCYKNKIGFDINLVYKRF